MKMGGRGGRREGGSMKVSDLKGSDERVKEERRREKKEHRVHVKEEHPLPPVGLLKMLSIGY